MDPEARQRRRLETFRQIAAERLERLARAWVAFEQEGAALEPLLRELHTLKGEAGLTGFAVAARLVHAVEDDLQRMQKEGRRPEAGQGDRVLQALAVIGRIVQVAPSAAHPEGEAMLAALRDRSVPSAPAKTAAGPPQPQAAETRPEAPEPAVPAGKPEAMVRVSAEKLDRLRDMVAELLLTRFRLQNAARELRRVRDAAIDMGALVRGLDEAVGRSCAQLVTTLSGFESRLANEGHSVSRLVAELDTTTRDLRMTPLRELMDRFVLPVRSLSREVGRRVRLETSGDDVEVDRAVLDRLEEPLLHLLRNAVDHGIEPPEVRQARGKDPEGTVRIQATATGRTLCLEVADDGAGVDREAVRRRARELGLLPQNGEGDDRQVLRTLFSAGVSTRREVSEVSGRGIGLNVVLEVIEALGGSLDVTSTPGAGTTFRLQVPISTTITRVLLFRVGDGQYALPAAAVRAVVDERSARTLEGLAGPTLRFGEEVIPQVSLPHLLGEPDEGVAVRRVLVVEAGEACVALTGSGGHTEREVVLKPVGAFFEGQPLVAAAVHLEDGSLALVLRPGELVAVGRRSRTTDAPATPDRPGGARTVLVADDSPVVRDLLAESLRAHGLVVIEASDGEEALSILGSNPRIDLVLTDIDMPRLDGIGLLRAVRARSEGRRLPVVVVSMRGSDGDRQAAMDAGADAYLVKSDFSQGNLWQLIARFVGRR